MADNEDFETESVFTLELLHFTDQEASTPAIVDAPNLSAVLNALRVEDLGADGLADNTLTLSSGDAIIPGVFFTASAAVFGSAGIADIQIQNELGVQAIAFGNHEFDLGTGLISGLISGAAPGDFSALVGTALDGLDFAGTLFPYLSTNLDVSLDANMAPLEVAGGGAPAGNVVSSSTVIDVNGEMIGVVGATTPTLRSISSPGAVGVSPLSFDGDPTPEQVAALAAEIQLEVGALLAANPEMNKVILLAHMQRIDIEFQLAELLENVDIIVAGGSNTRLFDEDDRIRAGDTDQGQYPQFFTNAGGTTTAVVNTDGSYKYVGRLVIDFDVDGNIIAESYDATVSGAYATDAQGVADLGAEGLIDPEIQAIVDAIENQIVSTQSNVFGVSDVFLNGARSGGGADGVRTQETNLGNLTADANLAAAKESDPTVLVSIKNGGGIRASIGEVVVLPGDTEATRLPGSAIVDGDGNESKPAGGISQNDIQTSLAFNNGLTLLTLTKAELVAVLEHGVAATTDQNSAQGRFPQVSGVEFSFDPALPAGDRIVSAAIVDENGDVLVPLVANGEIFGDPDQSFRIVTLNFLAGGGDGYPFPTGPEANRVDLFLDADNDGTADSVADGAPATGDAVFAGDGTEQDALAEYFADNYATPETAFVETDLPVELDGRIQNLDFRADAVLAGFVPGAPQATGELGAITVSRSFDSLAGEGGSEVVAHEDGRLYVTNGALGAIDIFDIASGALIGQVDLTFLPGFDGVQSVAVKNGLVAAAAQTVNIVDGGESEGRNGYIVLIDADAMQVIDRVTVGVLPDSIAFTPDGTKIVVANEGEFNEESDITLDPLGSISIVDVSDRIDPKVVTIDFTGLEAMAEAAGLRLAPGTSIAADIEPEYVSISPDGTTAFVTLQEANAVAVVDLATATIIELRSVDVVDHSLFGNEIDANDDGLVALRTHADLVGLRMPDAISTVEIGGQLFYLTANEGDGRGHDEARVGDILDGDVEGVSIDPSVNTEGLERLNISIIDGDTDGDGDIDVLNAFGSRSFTIFDADGNVVFDSGSEFERILAEIAPERFNNDDGETIGAGEEDEVDNRSDAKGPEPEAVAVGLIGDQTYAFIGLERDSGVMIYNITTPGSAHFVDYIDGFANSNIGPETIVFIPAEQSVSGAAQIAVAYEISGATVVYDLGEALAEPAPTRISEFQPNPDGADPSTVTIELSGEAGAAFDLWLLSIESDAGSSAGTVDRAMNVTGVFDGNGVATVLVDDLENPSFTYILTDDFTGSVGGTDIDANNDGVADDLSAFGAILDALGVPDTSGEPLYGAQLGGTDLVLGGSNEPRLVFRDGSTGDWYSAEGNTTNLFDQFGVVVDPAEFDIDPTAGTDTFGAINPTRGAAGMNFNLQVSEIWFGQDGADVTADWFEITNFGADAWTAATHGALFYDDDSAYPTVADLIQGIESIGAGESVIVVIGQQGDADAFLSVWGDDGLPAGAQIGFADGAGLGNGGDAVSLFLDAENDGLAAGDAAFEMEAYPDAAANSGQSWEVAPQQFANLSDFVDTVATTELGGDGSEPAIGSPGFIPTLGDPEPEITLIHDIQGSSDFSGLPGFAKVGVDDRAALEGQIVTIEAIVTADFQGALNLGGFFVQEEDVDWDADLFTSEGVFVFDLDLAGAPDVEIGDLVRVTGTVEEFFGQTQIDASFVEVVSSGNLLPTATVVDLGSTGVMLDDDAAVDYVVNFEAFEGMLVTFPETLTLTEMFNLDRFGEYRVSDGRPEQFTQSNDPSVEGFDAHLQEIAATGLVLDDGSNVQNPFTLEIIDGNDGVLTAADSFRMGDTLTNLTGVVAYGFDEFRLNDATADYSHENPRPAAPEEVGGNFKVASLNVLNYFTTLDTVPGSFNGPNTSGPNDDQEPRGANSTEELERQATKLVNAIVAMDADVLGLLELENDDDIAIADLVARVNAALGSEVYDFIATGDAGTDAVTTGIIYKIDTVAPVGAAAVLTEFGGQSFVDPLGAGSQQNRPSVAQSFQHLESGETMTVAVNHLKSKGSSTGVAADDDQLDGQGASNATRTAAVSILTDWLASDPTGSGAANQLIIGDLNAYASEDPIRALEAAGFTDIAGALLGDEAYSFVFDGQIGTLDYVLANGPAFEKVTGVAEWHVNADEADAIDYNIDIIQGVTRDPSLFDGTTAARNSDHDPVIVGFELQAARTVVANVEGRNVFIGADAAERFQLGDGEKDQLRFFDAASDVIDVSAWGVQSFAELSIADRGVDARGRMLVSIHDAASGNSAYHLGALEAAELTAESFVFAPVEDLIVSGQSPTSEKIIGRAGNDMIVGDGGFNAMFGQGGADAFVIGTGRGDQVMDFEDGVDLIDLTAWGVTSFAELAFGEREDVFTIRDEGGAPGANLVRIAKVDGLALADLGADDFIFADAILS